MSEREQTMAAIRAWWRARPQLISPTATLSKGEWDEIENLIRADERTIIEESHEVRTWRMVADTAVRVCLQRSVSLMDDGPRPNIAESNEAHKCAMAVGMTLGDITGYRPDHIVIEREIRATRGPSNG